MQPSIRQYLAVFLLLLSFGALADSSQVRLSDGWIKDLPPVVPMRAGYLTIENRGSNTATITGLQSDAFARIEMHETVMQDGLMKMVEIRKLEIAPRAKVELIPGGKHLMLITPQRTLGRGDDVDITVNFADGNSMQTNLPVR